MSAAVEVLVTAPGATAQSRLPTPPPSNAVHASNGSPSGGKGASSLPKPPSMSTRSKSTAKATPSSSSSSLSPPSLASRQKSSGLSSSLAHRKPASALALGAAARPPQPTTANQTPRASGSLSPPLAGMRSKSSLAPSHALSPAAKRKAVSDAANQAAEKDALILSLTDQVLALEARLVAATAGSDPTNTPIYKQTPTNNQNLKGPAASSPTRESSPALQIAQLTAKLKTTEMTVEKLEQRMGAFATKDGAVAQLMAEKEEAEARFDQIIKDKDMTIDAMRKQIEMQVMGLFAEVSKSRDLLVNQEAMHKEDLARLNAMVASQAAEIHQLRDELKESYQKAAAVAIASHEA
ncbi:hypothetical protein BC830DRAFT_1100661 [Chytriomyces sp. MP71]|nr:hypothetical protein BC830DRAFT_1100661 [Chytriomyces sp. MP71]